MHIQVVTVLREHLIAAGRILTETAAAILQPSNCKQLQLEKVHKPPGDPQAVSFFSGTHRSSHIAHKISKAFLLYIFFFIKRFQERKQVDRVQHMDGFPGNACGLLQLTKGCHHRLMVKKVILLIDLHLLQENRKRLLIGLQLFVSLSQKSSTIRVSAISLAQKFHFVHRFLPFLVLRPLFRQQRHKQATLDTAGNKLFVSAGLGVIVIGEGNATVSFP